MLVLEGTSLSRCSVGAKSFNIKPSDTSCDCSVHVLTIFMSLVSCNFAVLLQQCFVIVRELFKFYDLGLVVIGLECK